MKIRFILESKGRRVRTATPETTILDAVRMMSDHNIGALMVLDGDAIVGIVTERDCLHAVAKDPGDFGSRPVGDITSRDIVIAEPEGPHARAYLAIAERIWGKLAVDSAADRRPPPRIVVQ